MKGISLFVVPKFLLEQRRQRRARATTSLRQHRDTSSASRPVPTAVLQYGDARRRGRLLVGQENRGLEYMFIMMNAARYAVGVQGIAVAERAYQKAVAYARERVQSRPVDGSLPAQPPIIHHPDVKPHADDDARLHRRLPRAGVWCRPRPTTRRTTHPDAEVRKQNQAFYEFMVPLIKGYRTEMSLEVASLGVQVHGGMGFIEETGAAQHLRDAKILTDLRRHDRDPGQRPGGPQDRARRRRGGATRSRRRSRPPKANWPTQRSERCAPIGAEAPARGARGLPGRGRLRRRQDARPTRTPCSPARCRT